MAYVDPGRYLFYHRTKQYTDTSTGKIVLLNNKIWLPIHPADLFWDKMPITRKVEYINRWLKRHPLQKGWVFNAKNHWAHYDYDQALKYALSNKYIIKKQVQHGILKGILYQKINL